MLHVHNNYCYQNLDLYYHEIQMYFHENNLLRMVKTPEIHEAKQELLEYVWAYSKRSNYNKFSINNFFLKI